MEDEDGEAWFVPNATNADVVALFKQLSIEKRTECTTALQALGRGESANEAKDLVLPRDIETVAGSKYYIEPFIPQKDN